MNEELIQNVFDWGKAKGLHQDSLHPQFNKLVEEMGELAAGIARKDDPAIVDAVGDMLVVLIQLGGSYAKSIDHDDYEHFGPQFLDSCLYQAWLEIKNRKGKTVDGTFIKEEG